MRKNPDLKGRQALVIAGQARGLAEKISLFLEKQCNTGGIIQVESLDDALRALTNHRGITAICFSEFLGKSRLKGEAYPQALVRMVSARGRDTHKLLVFWFNPREGGELCRPRLN